MKDSALFLIVIFTITVRMDLSRSSAGRQRKRSFITVLGTKNAGKNEISEYLFFIHILFINNTSFTFVFLYKRLQKEKRV